MLILCHRETFLSSRLQYGGLLNPARSMTFCIHESLELESGQLCAILPTLMDNFYTFQAAEDDMLGPTLRLHL